MVRLLLFIALNFSWTSAFAFQSANEIARPDRWVQVTDPLGLIEPASTQEINRLVEEHRVHTGQQIAIVVVDRIEHQTPKQFAVELFQSWKIGGASKDNGLLILLSVTDKRVEFEVGYGLEGDLPDVVCKRIQMKLMVPAFQEGNFGKGLLRGVEAVVSQLNHSNQPLVSEPQPGTSNKTVATVVTSLMILAVLAVLIPFLWILFLNRKSFLKLFVFVVPAIGVMALVTLAPETLVDHPWFFAAGVYVFGAVTYLRFKLSSRTQIADDASSQARYSALVERAFPRWAVFVFPVPVLFFFLRDQRHLKMLRSQPQSCELCHQPMKLLDSNEELPRLSQFQKIEQQIKSVDHDVWLCANDGHVQIFHAKALGTRYSSCGHCQSVARSLTSDRVEIAATTASSGTGVRRYKCAACGAEDETRYTIPVKTSTSSSSSSSSSSPNQSGSSYSGGGRSGGGGAGSSW